MRLTFTLCAVIRKSFTLFKFFEIRPYMPNAAMVSTMNEHLGYK